MSRFHSDVVWYGLAWSVLLLAATNGNGVVRRALEWKPPCFVGLVSFSIYMWHLPVIAVLRPVLAGSGPLLTFPATLATSVVLAWLSFSSVPVAVLGGTLFANPFDVQVFRVAGASGELSQFLTWPPGVPTGIDLYLQFLIQDFSVPDQITLSNGVMATTP